MRAPRRTLAAMTLATVLASPLAVPDRALATDPNALPVLGQPHFSARFTGDGPTLRVSGRLLDEKGRGLSGRDVHLTMDGLWLASTRTSATGSFNFSHRVPESTMPGEHQVAISTKPGGGMTEAAAGSRVVVGRLRQARLSASLVTASGRPSGDLVLRGRVTDTKGRPLPGILVQGHFANGEWSDTFPTDAKGDYRGRVTIPIGSPLGRQSLQVTLNGVSGHAARPVAVVYTVLPGGPTSTPEPTASADTSTEGEDEAVDDSPSPTQQPTVTPTPTTSGPVRGPRSKPAPAGAWGIGALLGLGVLVSVASLGRGLDDDEGDEGRLIGGPD